MIAVELKDSHVRLAVEELRDALRRSPTHNYPLEHALTKVIEALEVADLITIKSERGVAVVYHQHQQIREEV